MMKRKLPIFPTKEGREQYLAAYEAMFSLWKVPYDAIDVKTSYGSTHINASGPEDGYPLVLLHGAGLSSTVWFANIAELSAQHRVYAIDMIGDAGKSVAERLLEKPTDYAIWLKEVFDGLNIERAQRSMPDLTAEIIPDAGHLLIMDQPETINAQILKFLGTG